MKASYTIYILRCKQDIRQNIHKTLLKDLEKKKRIIWNPHSTRETDTWVMCIHLQELQRNKTAKKNFKPTQPSLHLNKLPNPLLQLISARFHIISVSRTSSGAPEIKWLGCGSIPKITGTYLVMVSFSWEAVGWRFLLCGDQPKLASHRIQLSAHSSACTWGVEDLFSASITSIAWHGVPQYHLADIAWMATKERRLRGKIVGLLL